MIWGSDELHHRSAERSGWCAELRDADPEDVDDTVTGAVAYAAETTPRSDGADTPASTDDGEVDSCEPDADDVPDTGDAPDDPDGYVCALCGDDIPDGEALDAEGAPIDVGFEWVEDVEAYHRSCIEEGEGRFLPWAANGVLRDDATD